MNTKVMTLIKRITLIVLGVALLLSAGLVFLTSYTSWNDYYKQMLIKKERFDKEQEPEVTVMNGIRVSVKDGVGFFKNGKASADKANFIVEGLYTIGNEVTKRDYEEELSASDYTLTVPENFVENGGELKFNFKTEEEKKDEEGNTVYVKGDKDKGDKVDKDGFKLDEKGNKIPETVTVYDFTETMNIELLDVKLDHIEVTKNPYLVAYAEGDKFQSAGMTVNAVYNDGSKIENLAASLLDIKKDALTAEDKTVKLAYKYGEAEDEIIYGEVPVTVMAKNEFTNGELENLTVIGDVSLEVGKDVSSVKPVVYASYSSGNYIKLNESEYNVSGLKGVAEFGKKYNLVITSAVQPEISTRLSLYPTKSLAAEQATLKGATAYDGYVKDFDSGDYIEFVYNSATATVVNFYLNMSNGYLVYENGTFVAKAINFNDFAYVSVNGKLKQVSYGFSSGGPYEYMSDGLMTYDKVYIGAYAVKAGDNIVRICFKDSSSGVTAAYGQYVAGAIEKLEAATEVATSAYNSLGEYVVECKESGATEAYKVTKELEWGNFGITSGTNWVYAAATDGDYIYFYSNRAGSGDSLIGTQGATIIKYDPNEKKVVAYSAAMNYAGETNASIFTRDGYVYSIASDGTFMRLPTSFTGNGTAKVEYVPSLALKNEKGESVNATLKAVYYNQTSRKYAALSGSNISIYNAKGEYETSFAVKTSVSVKKPDGTPGNASAAKITGDSDYIYVGYKNNGIISPAMTIYDWSGKFIADVQPTNTTDIMGFATTGSCNVQSIVSLDGNVYFTMLRWVSGNQSSVYKVEAVGGSSEDKPVTENMDLYEYIEACENKGVTPSYIKTSLGMAQGVSGYAHGLATDGKYLFVSYNDTSAKGNTSIAKIEAATGKFIGRTVTFERGSAWNNGDYLCYMDGYVYVVLPNGTVKRVKADSITSSNEAVCEDYDLKINGLTANKFALTYNSLVGKIAVLAGGTVYIAGAKSLTVESSVASSLTKPMGIASDANYIYAFDEKNSEFGSALINVYDWSGNLVKKGVVVPNLITTENNNNVQSMCVINGEYYFLVCRWGSGGEIVKVSFDTSVLK